MDNQLYEQLKSMVEVFEAWLRDMSPLWDLKPEIIQRIEDAKRAIEAYETMT